MKGWQTNPSKGSDDWKTKEVEESKRNEQRRQIVPNGRPTNKWDICKKVDLKESMESSTSLSNWKSIKKSKHGNLNPKDVRFAMHKSFLMML